MLLVEKENVAYLGLMDPKGSQEMMHKDPPVLQVQKVAALLLSNDYAFFYYYARCQALGLVVDRTNLNLD